MFMGALPSCMSVYNMDAWCRQRFVIPGTEGAEGCKPSCGSWEPDQGALEEHPGF